MRVARQVLLVTAIALAAVTPLVVAAAYAHDTVAKTLHAQGAKDRQVTARVAAGLLQQEFERLGVELEDGAGDERNAAAIRRTRPELLWETLSTTLRDFPLARAMAAYDRNGEQIAIDGETHWLVGTYDVVGEAALRSSWIAQFRPATEDSPAAIIVSIAIREDTEVVGAFAVVLDPATLFESLRGWMRAPERALVLLDTGGATIVSAGVPGGTIVPEAGQARVWESAAMARPTWRILAVEERAVADASVEDLLVRLDLASAAAILGVLVLIWMRTRLYVLTREQGQSLARNAEEQQALLERLEHRATRDPLTDLPNRTLFNDRLTQALASSRRDGAPLAVLVLDLDGMKRVNDTLGHPAGDSLLLQVSARLRAALRESDTVARFGGDEFALILADADATGAAKVAEKVIGSIRRTYVIDQREVSVGASVGIAVSPRDGDDPVVLTRRADLAMYQAKQERSGWQLYTSALEAQLLSEVRVAGELRHAITEGGIELHYQPKIDVRTRRVRGIEALARWRHGERGLLGPSEFLPDVIRAGLDRELDEAVLRRAAQACRSLRRLGLMVPISVNVGARLMEAPGFPALVRTVLREAGLSASDLILELTEQVALRDPRAVGDRLRELAAEGVGISIDDFGTGYSSLAVLQHIPATELKIDRRFVHRLGSSKADAVIVRAAISVAHGLGMQVTAEGIETEATMTELTSLRCDQAQGYAIARPLPMSELVPWLLDRTGVLDPSSMRSYAGWLHAVAERSEIDHEPFSEILDHERDGIDAVLAWATTDPDALEVGLGLAAALRAFWVDRGLSGDGRAWLERLLAVAAETGAPAAPAVRAESLSALGVLIGEGGDLDHARELFLGAAEAARAAGVPITLARSLANLGVVETWTGRLDAAEAATREASLLFQREGHRRARGRELNNLAAVHYLRGDHAAAGTAVTAAVALLRRFGERRQLADALETLGSVALAEGRSEQAWTAFEECLRLYGDLRVQADVVQPLTGVAALLAEHDPATAVQLAGAAEAMRGRHQGKPPLSASLLAAALARIEGRLSEDTRNEALARGRGLDARAAIELALEKGSASFRQAAAGVRPAFAPRVDLGLAAA